MKTLYININNEQIQSNEVIEVLNYDLDSDFFFYLGEKIAKGCKVENENALITDFNTQDNAEDYQKIIAKWHELKTILFSEKCKGKFEFRLPNGYIHWLRYSEQYNHVYDKKFYHGESTVITIDLEKLYKDSVEGLQSKILRKLQRDDLYLETDEIVFNDDAVTRKSPIIAHICKNLKGIKFILYSEYKQRIEEEKSRKERERLEQERAERLRLEQERAEKERIEREQLGQEQDNYMRILVDFFVTRIFHIDIRTEEQKNDIIEKFNNCLRSRDDEDIIVSDGFDPSIYTNPSSPFYGGKPGIKVHISKQLKSLFQLFVKFCDYSNTSDHYIISEICDIVCDIDRYINDYKSLQIVKVPYLGGFNRHTKYYCKWRVEVIDNQFRAKRI